MENNEVNRLINEVCEVKDQMDEMREEEHAVASTLLARGLRDTLRRTRSYVSYRERWREIPLPQRLFYRVDDDNLEHTNYHSIQCCVCGVIFRDGRCNHVTDCPVGGLEKYLSEDQAIDLILYESLKPHLGHKVEIVQYGLSDGLHNLAVECITCSEVIASSDNPE